MHKSRSEYRDGYKAHIAIEPETGLVTACALTPANAPDGSTGVELLAGEEPGLQVLGDGAYGSGETLSALGKAKHHRAIKPWPTTPPCPVASNERRLRRRRRSRHRHLPGRPHGHDHPEAALPSFGVRCRGCPLRDRCTNSKDGRTLHLHPHDNELVESRRAWREGDFAEDYRRWRPMVERSIAWLVADNHRRVRFRGVERNQLGLSLRIAAINLRRLVNLGLEPRRRVDPRDVGVGGTFVRPIRPKNPVSEADPVLHPPPALVADGTRAPELGECRLFNLGHHHLPLAFASRMSTARLIASRTSFAGSAPVHSCQRESSHLQPFMYSGAALWSITAPDSRRGLNG